VHSQLGPIFHRDVFFRPNAEFAFGEVTDLIALNLEAIYRLPVSSRRGNWSALVGIPWRRAGLDFRPPEFPKPSRPRQEHRIRQLRLRCWLQYPDRGVVPPGYILRSQDQLIFATSRNSPVDIGLQLLVHICTRGSSAPFVSASET
jgi:hypothetical protein